MRQLSSEELTIVSGGFALLNNPAEMSVRLEEVEFIAPTDGYFDLNGNGQYDPTDAWLDEGETAYVQETVLDTWTPSS